MKLHPPLLALLLTILLCGCPAVSGPDGPQARVRQLGMVTIGANYNDEGNYEVYGAGGLFLPVERTAASLEQVTDRCLVNDYPPVLPDEAFKTLLDAGEFIDVRTNGRPFAALVRVNFMGGGYGYTAGEFGTYPAVPEQGLVAEARKTLDGVRQALGDKFAVAWNRGRSLSLNKAVRLAKSDAA